MKASYNINADLKQEIDLLMDRNSKYQLSIEDAAEELMDVKRAKDKQREKEIEEREEIIKELTESKSTIQKELNSFKQEYNTKMQEIKLLEIELEQKLQNAKGSNENSEDENSK